MSMTRPQTMAAAFVSVKTALDNCVKSGNTEWERRWHERLSKLIELIPSGNGIDRGPSTWRAVEVQPGVIRFDVSYHHMNDGGFYNGWTDHTVTIRPAFDDINVQISGRDRHDIKDHLHEVMHYAFTRHVEWDEPALRWMEIDDAPRRDDPPTHKQEVSQSSARDMFPSDCPDRD